MISKELLSEVLKDKLKEEYNGSYDFICNGVVNLERNEVSSTLGFYDSELDFFINIYEFAFKCKEWAYENNYYVYSTPSFALEGVAYIVEDNNIGKRLKTLQLGSEVEAVIKACEWILDNKEIKWVY